MGFSIIGSGSYLPGKPIPNSFFGAELPPVSELDNLFKGAAFRHHSAVGEEAFAMSKIAAERAIEDWGGDRQDIDALFVYHFPHDYLSPNDSYRVLRELGMGRCVARIVDTACSTFVTALRDVDAFITAGRVRRALIICTANWVNHAVDRNLNYAVTGDGSAAVLVERRTEPAILDSSEVMMVEHLDVTTCRNGHVTGRPERFVFRTAAWEDPSAKRAFVRQMIEPAVQVMKNLQLTGRDIDWFIPHQPGLPLVHAWAEILGIPQAKVLHTYERTANMNAANVPYIIDCGRRSGDLRPGQRVLLFAQGTGMNAVAVCLQL